MELGSQKLWENSPPKKITGVGFICAMNTRFWKLGGVVIREIPMQTKTKKNYLP
jgi:hypothetical protein